MNIAMKRFLVAFSLILVAAGCALTSAPVVVVERALAFTRGPAVEDPPVADGLTISSYLVSGSDNNIDGSTALTNAFSVVAGSPTVTVSFTNHGLSVSNLVTFYNSTVVGGLSADGAWIVASVPNANTFTFTHTANANATTGPTGSTIISKVATDVDAKLRFLCVFSHLSYDDPILFPGIPNATHLHLFFGNTLTDYNSTYASLRASGDGTCQGGPLNRTGYWMPAMIDSSLNKVRIPIDFQWYYAFSREQLVEITSPACPNGILQDANFTGSISGTVLTVSAISSGRLGPSVVVQGGTSAGTTVTSFGTGTGGVGTYNINNSQTVGSRSMNAGRPIACPQKAIKKIERGMRAVMGFKVSTGRYPDTYLGPSSDILAGAYSCEDTNGNLVGGTYRYLHHRTIPSLGLSSNVLCPSDGLVRIRNQTPSPSCWNGSHTGTDDFNQMATGAQDGNSNFLCPASHPYPFMGFTVIATYSYTGGISQLANWYLSSDRFNGANYEAGETFHWDMWWAWNDQVQEHFHKYVHGMFPNPASSTHAGGPYLYSWIGTQANVKRWVSGPFVRNENTGGLSGNAGIGDCTALGLPGKCSLNTETGPLSDQLVDIPPDPG